MIRDYILTIEELKHTYTVPAPLTMFVPFITIKIYWQY